ncbi:MAG: tetratricopeptide repeat protein [Deltaproteobacteria bacterium]|nr:tetratricopeptide repeat protein [Deltaproteobacteria bacterium]
MLSAIRTSALVAVLALVALARPARAQLGEVDVQRGPTAELYVRKRPPAPAAPVISPELQKLLNAARIKRDAKREQAIGLLREFLASNPLGESKADGMFKLAELLWEEARRQFLVDMDTYDRKLEACRTEKACKQPTEPRIQLREAEVLYKQILAEFPGFRRADLILYLVGFAAKEDGREDEALASFQQVIKNYPQSPLYGDAWMQVGEHYFGQQQWADARGAYENVLSNPNAPTYDLAMFKSAWCDWKLGEPEVAAKKFKIVLDLAIEAERAGNPELARRRANLRDEALEYLVVVFTEDRAISAKEVFDFLASIGGERYSRDILIKVADSYASQGEYERAADTYRFLVAMDPDAMGAAAWQRQIVDTWIAAGDYGTAQHELAALVEGYGPTSAWAKKQRNKDALANSLGATEALARQTAVNLHAEAQIKEKRDKKPDLAAYQEAASAYGIYLGAFGDAKTGAAGAAELRFYRAQILFFKLGKLEEAGDEFLMVGRSTPVGKFHKDALLAAMDAFEKARPKDTAGKRQLLPVDTKFAEAVDLYATLFPADPKLVEVIFKNGQLFYDYGNYDEAIKRFGLIVTKYPDDPNAGPAGDRILKGLAQAQDYENIEDWARRLKKAKAFAAPDQQARLDRLIVDSIGKSGDKYADAGKYEQAAQFYLRIPKEFPKDKAAPQKMMNAGVMYEKAKLPERAADAYLGLADQFPDSDLAEKAAFSAGQVYERVAYFDRAAQAYELVAEKFATKSKSDKIADALYNAGVLRQALGQNDKAIAHYQQYAKKYRERKDADDVQFRIAEVYEAGGDDGHADQAFRAYLQSYPNGARVVEAHVRAGRTSFRLGQLGRAAKSMDDALRIWKRAGGKEKDRIRPFAAEARYYQGELIFRDYEKITLDVKPKDLNKTLKKKAAMLDKAQTAYLDVVNYEDLKWATAALYRVGQVYDGFAEALTSAPTPAGLSEADQQAYRDGLDSYVIDIQDKAVELFSTGYQKAIQMQVYDQYTAKIREALGRLAADKYPPEREARGKVRTGDRPLTLDLVEEVAR